MHCPRLFPEALCAVIAVALGLSRPLHAQPASIVLCPGGARPVVGGGRNDVLGLFGELGVRCGVTDRGFLTLGFRYAESRANILPWGALSLSWPVREAVTLTLSVGVRERLGDWEGDRLPEVGLRWNFPDSAPLPGWLETASGLFNVYGAQSGVMRTGLRLNLSTRRVALGQFSAWLGADTGYYRYSTGDNHPFLTWTANLRISLVRDVSVQLAYLHADSSGSSPLRFDVVGTDRYWTVHLQGMVDPTTSWRLGVLLDSAGGRGIREYQASLGVGANWFSVTYRTTDQRLLVGVSLAEWSGR